jgi:hypothetical protein
MMRTNCGTALRILLRGNRRGWVLYTAIPCGKKR